MVEASSDSAYCVANLLVDARGGGILQAHLSARLFCGYSVTTLQAMNVAELFGQSVADILHAAAQDPDRHNVIPLNAKTASGHLCPVQAHADRASPDGTFSLAVFENRADKHRENYV
ncbi:MAG: hypothetical protein AB7U30_07760 [Sulfuricellaceae bacterium]|jgi:hypothetical protein